MTTSSTIFHPVADQPFISQLLSAPLPESADLFDVADLCCAFVCVLIETDDRTEKMALCGRLTHALERLSHRCDCDLPEHLIAKLTAATIPQSAIPDCWSDSSSLIGYSRALTTALTANVLDAKTEEEITGLLHDLVYLLAEQVKTARWVCG